MTATSGSPAASGRLTDRPERPRRALVIWYSQTGQLRNVPGEGLPAADDDVDAPQGKCISEQSADVRALQFAVLGRGGHVGGGLEARHEESTNGEGGVCSVEAVRRRGVRLRHGSDRMDFVAP